MIQGIPDYRNPHFVRPNKVAFKCFHFKKDVELNVHVKIFKFKMKVNVKTSKIYIINVFSYMLKDMILD
jgi:hypothetical protein